MDRVPKRLLRMVAIIVLLTLGAWGLLARAAGGLCSNTVLTTVPSPDGTHQAIVFGRDCGASTGFSTQVSILHAGARLSNNVSSNTFVADADNGIAPAGRGGGPRVEVEWREAELLEVRHDSRARVFRTESHVRGITVQTVAITPGGA